MIVIDTGGRREIDLISLFTLYCCRDDVIVFMHRDYYISLSGSFGNEYDYIFFFAENLLICIYIIRMGLLLSLSAILMCFLVLNCRMYPSKVI